MNITNMSPASVEKIIQTLKSGGLVVAPSDTVYGLLVDATNETAVRKLLAFKNRPIGKPISIFVSDYAMLSQQVEVSETQTQLLKRFLPGPFTVVLPSKHAVSRYLESEKGTLGVRIPSYPFITELVARFGKPVTATSANVSGKSPHHSTTTLLNELSEVKKGLIDLVVDGGTLPRNKPSTVIDMTTSKIQIVRKGDIIWRDEETYISESAAQTRKLAAYLIDKLAISPSKRPVAVIMEGDLGAGKTEFVRGAAGHLHIDRVVSPTYVIYYEYEVPDRKPFDLLYHFDLYQIEDAEEFKHLGIDSMFNSRNILFFEWGGKAGPILDMLKDRADIVHVGIKHVSEKQREITFNL